MKIFRTYYTNVVLLLVTLMLTVSACGGTAPVPPDIASRGPTISELEQTGFEITDAYDVTVPAYSYVIPGDVIALGLGATVRGLASVSQGASGTAIYTKNLTQFFFAWPVGGSNYGFVSMSQDGQIINTMINGNSVNTLSMSKLIRSLESNGWKIALPADLPVPLFTALANATTWLRGLATSVASPAIFFIPAGGFFDPNPVAPIL